MEAAAALGIAGNVVQFLDFSQKLSKTILEIWKSTKGIAKSSEHTEIAAQTFLESLDCVSNDLCEYRGFLSQQNNGNGPIQSVIDGCRELADDLINHIDKLRVTGQPRKWKSIAAAMKTLWQEQELLVLEGKLSKLRNELETRVLFSLRTSMTMLETQQKHISESLLDLRRQDQWDSLQASMTAAIEKTISTQIRALPPWPLKQVEPALVSSQVTATDTKSALKTTYYVHGQHTLTAESQQSLERDMAQLYAKKLVESEDDVINSLSFSVMHDREDAITDAEVSTFDWIFKAPQSASRSWNDFNEWLQSDKTLYWINGKAGSGKSTLMKYLVGHTRTRGGLLEWAGDTKLLLVKFFFWYSGYELQKSQIGLLRGLLYSCLKGHRELIPLVVPEVADVSGIDLDNYWTMQRLRRAFQRLMTQKEFDLKFCFFIDGLDEYAGNHLEIADFAKEIAAYPNVKICVSSRPLAVFDPAFRQFPQLILQHLTFDDISLYTNNKLTTNYLMGDLELREPGLTTELTSNIVTKASGVFLWVRLVVQSLLDGLSNSDDGKDLRRRLDDLPEDLEKLYWHMIERVTPKWYLEEGFRLLRMVQAVGGEIPLLELCLAEQTQDLYQDVVLCNPSLEEQKLLCEKMNGRLKSRCLGLLETSGFTTQNVTFIHKSVYDFLKTDAARACMLSIPGQNNFHPEVALMHGALLEIKLFETRLPEKTPFKRNHFFDHIRPVICKFFKYARVVEKRYQRAEVELIDELERTVDIIWDDLSFRTQEEKSGALHWLGAPRNPLATPASDGDSGEEVVCRSSQDSASTTETQFPISWQSVVNSSLNATICIHSFADVVRSAELRHYMDAKQISWKGAEAFENAKVIGRTSLLPAEILTFPKIPGDATSSNALPVETSGNSIGESKSVHWPKTVFAAGTEIDTMKELDIVATDARFDDVLSSSSDLSDSSREQSSTAARPMSSKVQENGRAIACDVGEADQGGRKLLKLGLFKKFRPLRNAVQSSRFQI